MQLKPINGSLYGYANGYAPTLAKRRRPLPPGQAAMARAGAVSGAIRPLPRVPAVHPAVTPGVDPLLTAANAQVAAMNAPLIQQLAAARAQAEASARAQYARHAQALEQGLMATAPAVAGAYQGAEQSAATTEDALRAKLRGEGESAGQSLAAKLAQIGAPAAANPNLAQTYTGAANAGTATGYADLQKLIARGAEAQSYTAKLPQLARLESNRALEGVLAGQREAASTQDTEMTSQSVQNAFDLWQQAKKEKVDLTQSREKALSDEKDRASKEKLALQALYATATTKAQQLAVQKEMKDADRRSREAIAQLNAQTRLATDNPPTAPKVASGPSMKFNPDGSPNPNYGKSPASGKGAGSTASQVRLKRNKAVNDINKIFFNPMTQKNRQWVESSATTWGMISSKINASITSAGLDPNSPVGKSIRAAAYKRMGVKLGAKGNPVGWDE